MGHLFIELQSFEFKDISEKERDRHFADFCKAINCCRIEPDNLYSSEDIYTHQLSYGNLITDFIYASWDTIKSQPSLKGLSSTTLNLYQSLMYSMPGMVSTVASKATFAETFNLHHYGYSGLRVKNPTIPYVSCENSWNNWKISWLSKHNEQIKWSSQPDNFLPNKEFSESLLERELDNHGFANEIKKHKSVGQAFHDLVMRPKVNNDLIAYTDKIGTQIAESNYYRYSQELSKNEERKTGSKRKIFELINKNGDKQYISLDFQHGMFEYHDKKGKHLGEFKFDGSYNKGAEPSHDLKTL